MFSKVVLIFSLILVQLFSISEAQAQMQDFPGYTPWDTKVRNLVGCGNNNTTCEGTFIQSKPIISMTTQCWGTMCPATVGATYVGNDALQVYQAYLAQYSYWINKTDYPKLIFSNSTASSGATNVSFTVIQATDSSGSGHSDGYNSDWINVSCNGYIDGLGCANDDLDRTSMDDGPCEICSKVGNPFDVRNGAKYEHAVDLDFPIAIVRNYSSRKRIQGMFGMNWRSNFDKSLKVVTNNNIITSLIFTNPNGEYIILQGTDGTNFNALFKNQRKYKVSIANGQIKLVRPDSGIEIYDLAASKILSETYKGKTLTYQYNNYGLISRVVDSFGRYLQFSYSNYANVVEEIYASNGDDIVYSYDNGNVSNIKLNNINQITYQYSGYLLTGKLDGQGVQYASFSYDAQGRGVENKWITSDGHEIKKYSVSYLNNQTSVTQNNGFSRTYNMQPFEYAQMITNMSWNGKSEQTNIDSNGNVLNKTDLDGITESYGYDSDGRINSYQKDGKLANITWNSDLNLATQVQDTTANGWRTTTNYYGSDGADFGYKITGNGGEQHLNKNRDSYGRLTSEEYDTGLVKTYTYYPIDVNTNENGLLASITLNTGQSIVINSYDNRGNPTSMTTNGVTKTMTYDYKGRVLSETVNGATNTYTYDANGNMLTASMATGYQLTMTYDSAGRLLNITDNMGGSTSFSIDDYTNEVLNTTITQNNALVRAKNKIIDALGRTTQTWNATARTKQYNNYASRATVPDSTTDANGIQSTYSWNSQNLVTGYSSGADSSSNSYDVDGNQTSVVVNNQTTTMSYDDFGRITNINSPDTGARSFSYSQSQDSYTDAKGTIHTLTKGAGGLPVNFTHTNNDPDLNYANYESYQYDNYGRVNKISSQNSETLYGRDSLGQLTSKTTNMLISGFKPMTVSYGYNQAGQKVSDTYPSGLVINYGYTNGFLTSISAGGTPIVSNINYNSMLKEPVSWNLGGNQVTMTKDTDGLLTGFVDSGVFNQVISTDNEGHITSLADSVSNNNLNVSLNSNYGLAAGTINGKTLNYQFGQNHNTTVQQDGLTNFEFEYINGTNKIDSLWLGGSDTHWNYQYDGNGNLRTNQHGTYQYDGENRLEYYTDNNGNMVRYYYDGLNQRIGKRVMGGQLKYFVYNENNQLIGEYDESGNAIAEYIYFGLRPVAVKKGGTLYTVHTDYLGTPRVVTNGGSVVWQWKNDNPYGNNIAQGSIEFNLRFSGQYYDSESGLNYNIHRTYDPESGRYLQSDPLGLSAGFNTYNYVNKNPLDGVDPLGLVCNGTGCWESPAEKSLREQGRVVDYYNLACQGGDGYACNAGRIAADDGTSTGLAGLLTPMTNVRLKDSILGNLRNPSNEEILRAANAVPKIKLELMQGYGEYLAGACEKKPIKPSREFITNLHRTVFQRNGADPDIFGGSTVDKSYWLDLFIRRWGGYDWCPNCGK